VLTEAATGTLSWTPSSVVANYVAAACATTTVTQAGTGGKDF
jgi:hypothetical protein